MEYTKIPNIFKREEFGKNRLIEGDFSSDELEYLADNLWVWTEKVDGTNIRVIWDGHSVMWLRPDALKDIADSFGIQAVPQVGGGSLYDAVKFIKTHPKSKLRDAEMEGVVCRPLFELADRRGNRIIVKIKCRDFPLEGER